MLDTITFILQYWPWMIAVVLLIVIILMVGAVLGAAKLASQYDRDMDSFDYKHDVDSREN